MEAVIPGIDQETQKIISTYQKLYNLIFKFGSFIVLGVLSLIVVISIRQTNFIHRDDLSAFNGQFASLSTVITSGSSFIAKGVALNPPISTQPISVHILQGFVDVSSEAQMGYGALAYHSGIVLPISINLTTRNDNYTIEYLGADAYIPADLDSFIKDTILTYPVRVNPAILYRKSPITKEIAAMLADHTTSTPSLNEQYGLSCLGKRHITSFFCYKNIQQFIARMPYMTFENNLDELEDAMSRIMQTPYRANACTNLQFAFSKIAVSDRIREQIFSQCGQEFVTAYHRIVDFSNVTLELQGISNTKLYSDEDINLFKLLSLQQKIYHNTLQKNYDVGTIEVYLTFVQDLLTKRGQIPQLYKDVIYLYNNTYLYGTITQIAVINNNTKALLRLTDVIRNINEGSIQLKRSINNGNLITYVENMKIDSSSQQNLVTFQDLFTNTFTTFGSFIVTNQKVDNDMLTATVEGYFMVNEAGEEKKILFVGEYQYKNDGFVLSEANFPQNAYLETALTKLIEQNNLDIDIPFVYEFIRNNSSYSTTNVSVCDIIATRVALSQCSNAGALLDIGSTGNAIMFTFDGYNISSISSQNKEIEGALRTQIQGAIITQDNIASIVYDMSRIALTMLESMPATDTSASVDTNQFTIISKFKQFLGVTPDMITQSEGKYIVEFQIAGIGFVTVVDLTNNYKLFPMAVKQGSTVTRINNLSLNLTNIALSEINQFKADPWGYIYKLDPQTYDKIYPKNNK